MMFCQRGVDDTDLQLGWKRNPPQGNLVQDLAQKCNQKQNHYKKVARVGCKITNRCIDSRSPVASSNAQSNNSTSKQEIPITTSIRP
jgi:hypothetical protein